MLHHLNIFKQSQTLLFRTFCRQVLVSNSELMAGKKVLVGVFLGHKTSLPDSEKAAQPAKPQCKVGVFIPIPIGAGFQSSKCITRMFTDMKYHHGRLEVALYNQKLSADSFMLKLQKLQLFKSCTYSSLTRIQRLSFLQQTSFHFVLLAQTRHLSQIRTPRVLSHIIL